MTEEQRRAERLAQMERLREEFKKVGAELRRPIPKEKQEAIAMQLYEDVQLRTAIEELMESREGVREVILMVRQKLIDDHPDVSPSYDVDIFTFLLRWVVMGRENGT